jgi:hypothetical protein
MKSLVSRILDQVAQFPEATPIYARTLSHLGERAAVNQALARLARRGQLMRADRGLYLCPVETGFGTVLPEVWPVLQNITAQSGETFAPNFAVEANCLRVTTQVPMREIYLTSGRSRNLTFGKRVLELRHAPRWQLLLAGRRSGGVIRALVWLGTRGQRDGMRELARQLLPETRAELAGVRKQVPPWIADRINRLLRRSRCSRAAAPEVPVKADLKSAVGGSSSSAAVRGQP